MHVGVARLPVNFFLESENRGGREADVAVADPARAEVTVLFVHGQRREILYGRRIAKPADLRDIGAALELHDIAVAIDKGLLTRFDADRANRGDFSRGGGREAPGDDLALLEVG